MLTVTAAVYWPGLSGAFLLDDYQNLKGLESLQPFDWPRALLFSITGPAGEFGRPVAQITFALQAASWPSDPFAFKLVNLGLHLINGVLVWWLIRLIGVSSRNPQSGYWGPLAIVVAAAWLLHPLNVSTVLYVVQRMTLLAATFSLLGLVGYLAFRIRLQQADRWRAYLAAGACLWIGGLLGTLAKEIGVLTLVYAAVLEYTVLAPVGTQRWRVWRVLALWTPLATLAAVFAVRFQNWILAVYDLRTFTLGERLMTEARVLVDYLVMIVIPRPHRLGLFHDDFLVSRGLLDPPSTLVAIALIGLLLTAAAVLRRRAAIFALAVLWFLGGHLLESTFIPLELYFEHRNYLPMIGPLLVLAWLVWALLQKVKGTSPRPSFLVLASGAGVLLAGITLFEARLWGDPVRQALVWGQERPRSLRAQENLGNTFAKAGRYQDAAKVFEHLTVVSPRDPTGYFLWVRAACYDSAVELPSQGRLVGALEAAERSVGPAAALEQIVLDIEDGRCPSLEPGQVKALLRVLITNARYTSLLPQLYALAARLEALDGRLDAAITAMDESFRRFPDPTAAIRQAIWSAQLGDHDRALRYLRLARESSARSMVKRTIVGEQVERLEAEIERLRAGKETQ
ncbi:MAG: tetratricopeptide repeat protein [Pseudomonadota bacterium]